VGVHIFSHSKSHFPDLPPLREQPADDTHRKTKYSRPDTRPEIPARRRAGFQSAQFRRTTRQALVPGRRDGSHCLWTHTAAIGLTRSESESGVFLRSAAIVNSSHDFRHLVKQGCRYPRAENPIGLPQTKLSRPVVTIPSRILERVDATAEALGQ